MVLGREAVSVLSKSYETHENLLGLLSDSSRNKLCTVPPNVNFDKL